MAYCWKRGATSFDRKLAQELLAAHQNKGAAIQKRESVHQSAVSNQAAAHFRWRVGGAVAPGSVDMDKISPRPVGRRVIKRENGGLLARVIDVGLDDRPVEVNDEGRMSTCENAGVKRWQSASSFGEPTQLSHAHLARILGVSTVLVFVITFVAAAVLSA